MPGVGPAGRGNTGALYDTRRRRYPGRAWNPATAATSALDNRSQALISGSLACLKATRIVVAHRLSTIRSADRILVMQNGEFTQCGSYEQLASQPGLLAELAARQALR